MNYEEIHKNYSLPLEQKKYKMNHERLNLMKEPEVWKAFLQGNEHAYAFIYQNYFSRLYSYGKRFTSDEGLIEDAIQLLFTQLWKNRANLNPTASVQNYLYKSFRRKVLRLLQKKDKRMEAPLLENSQFNTTLSPELQFIQDDDLQLIQDQLQSAFYQLTDRQREAIYLKYYEKLSNDEIARIMEVDVNAIYNLVYKGIRKLKKIIFPHKKIVINTTAFLMMLLLYIMFL